MNFTDVYQEKKSKLMEELLENSRKLLLNSDENYLTGLFFSRAELFERLRELDSEASRNNISLPRSPPDPLLANILDLQKQIILNLERGKRDVEKRLSGLHRHAQTRNYLKFISGKKS